MADSDCSFGLKARTSQKQLYVHGHEGVGCARLRDMRCKRHTFVISATKTPFSLRTKVNQNQTPATSAQIATKMYTYK